MVVIIDEVLGKRRSYGEPSTAAPTLKRVRYKNVYRFMAVTNMNATFNKLSIFAFCVRTSRLSSTYAIGKFYLNFKQMIQYLFPLSL